MMKGLNYIYTIFIEVIFMKLITFDTRSKPSLTCATIFEQVSMWLSANPNVMVKEIQMNESDARLLYEFHETAFE